MFYQEKIWLDNMLNSDYTNLVNSLLQPAILLDRNFQVITKNKEAVSYFNNQPDVIISKKIIDLIQTIQKHNSTDFPTELILASAEGASLQWAINPLHGTDTIFYLILCKEKINTSSKPSDITLHIIEELAEVMPGNFYWKSAEGVYLGCNQSLVDTLNFSDKSSIVGKTDYDLWPHQADELRQNDLYVMQTGNALKREEVALLADGSPGYFTAIKVPLKSNNKEIIGIIGNSIDITAEKRKMEMELENQKLEIAMQEAKAKSAADEATKRALLIFSGMSTHDLRTPLSSISLQAMFLKKYIKDLAEGYKAALIANLEITPLKTKTLEDLQRVPSEILQGVLEANDYIDSSLKSLRSASQGEELIDKDQLVDCNADRLLSPIITNYPYKENQKALLHWDREYDFNFKGNSIFFTRLIENLLKNAFEQIELKERGEIFIKCSQNDYYNTITIKDTAGGVTQEILDKIFMGMHSTKKDGTGIGLSSAKQIMQGMNGEIDCHVVDSDCIEFVLSFPHQHS